VENKDIAVTLRPVLIRPYYGWDTETKACFHDWGYNEEKISRAIVEYEDGTCHMVRTECIQFLDREE
jgi:hypothetical protein